MKFEEDQNEALYRITGYESEGININGRLFSHSLILAPNALVEDWKPEIYSQLTEDDLDPIYALKPEVIIIATGKSQVFPSREILKRLAKEQIGYEIMSTEAACRTFNIIMSEGRNIVIGFFID